MKIKSIYIDGLHNAVNKTYDFGDVNYIYGNNGIGKSTILQAIQFALLGYIPGTAKNSKEALLRHSPKGHINVQICLTDTGLGFDITIHRQVTSKITSVDTVPGDICISDIIKDIELPIFNFNEFVGQTANKLKEYFIKNILPTANGNLDWSSILTEAISEHNFQDKDSTICYGLSLIPPVDDKSALDQVIATNAAFKEELSFKKSELQRLQGTIDSLIFYDDYKGTTDINEINTKLLAAGSLRDQLIAYSSAESATRTAKEELDRLNAELNALGGQAFYDECTANLPKLKEQHKILSNSIANKQNALAALRATDATADTIIQSKGICPYTKEECKSIQAKIDDLRNESIKRKANNVALADEIKQDSDKLNKLNAAIRKCESDINDFLTTWNRIVTLEKTMQDLPQKPDTDKTIFDLDVEIAQLTQDKEKLQANIQYNATIDNITKMKYKTELQIKALSSWVTKTDTNGLQTTLMEAPFKDLANTLTNLIGAMYGDFSIKAHFNISTKANSFSFGLIRNDIYIPYDLLSSGEKCLYTLALMICITNADKSPLKLLLCDDMFDHLDSYAIESTFDTLKAYNKLNEKDIQFIFAGVKECQEAKDILITV